MPLNHSSTFSELTNEQYVILGKAVVEWANIEYLLTLLLGRLLGSPDFLSRTFTDSFTASRLQVAIQEAVEIHRHRYNSKVISANLLNEIDELNLSINQIRSTRNKIAHFCWCRESDYAIFGTSFSGGMPTEKSEKRNVVVFTIDEIKLFHSDAFAIVERLIDLTQKLPTIEEDQLFTQLIKPAR